MRHIYKQPGILCCVVTLKRKCPKSLSQNQVVSGGMPQILRTHRARVAMAVAAGADPPGAPATAHETAPTRSAGADPHHPPADHGPDHVTTMPALRSAAIAVPRAAAGPLIISRGLRDGGSHPESVRGNDLRSAIDQGGRQNVLDHIGAGRGKRHGSGSETSRGRASTGRGRGSARLYAHLHAHLHAPRVRSHGQGQGLGHGCLGKRCRNLEEGQCHRRRVPHQSQSSQRSMAGHDLDLGQTSLGRFPGRRGSRSRTT